MATGILYEAVQAVKTSLATLNLKTETDPRNARPFCVFIQLPTFDSYTYNIGDIRIPIQVLAPPPGNQDASNYLLTTVDTIMNSPIAVADGRPGLANFGGQDLPCYELTIAVAVRRN